MRVCDLCGELDTEPRHVIGHGPGQVPLDVELLARVAGRRDLPAEVQREALEALQDTTLQLRHIPCCAAAGCDLCTLTTTQEH